MHRLICHSLPFTTVPREIMTYMVFYVVKLLNYFPVKSGVSTQLSPKAILSSEIIHFKYYQMPFGSYCQINEEDVP